MRYAPPDFRQDSVVSSLNCCHHRRMHHSDGATVVITEEGRSGSVIYRQGEIQITGWWEFAGSDAIAIVNMGRAAEWPSEHPWSNEQRGRVLRFVADEIIRQKCAGCVADIDEESGWITIRR